MVDTMREPRMILDALTKNAVKENYIFTRLYRNLYNKKFFLDAYGNIYHKPGNMTQGTDKETIDGFSMDWIENIISSLKDESYKPNPSRRVYIPKKDDKQRPLGIPSIKDKIIQEVVKEILVSMYEPIFSKASHGFRPNKSCHSALNDIKMTFGGIKWWIEGDIKGFFDNIDHHVLIGILRKRIKDEKFIKLIWKFLKAGYMEDWKFNKTFSGTPQGGIISPVLANIYLHELDAFMEKQIIKFDEGKRRRDNPVYKKYNTAIWYRKNKLKEKWNTLNDDERKELQSEISTLEKEREKHSAVDNMDASFKRLKYVRYADDFVVGVIGSKEDSKRIKEEITEFLHTSLKLELSQEKTLITSNKNLIKFLGYEIGIDGGHDSKTNTNGIKKRHLSGKPMLYLPYNNMRNFLLKNDYMKIEGNDWKPVHRRYLVNQDDIEILSTYNAEIRGFYEYYKMAINVYKLNGAFHIIKTSFAKTMANKYKLSVNRVFRKYSVNGVLGVFYDTKNGKKFRPFYNDGFKMDKQYSKSLSIDTLPNTNIYSGRTSLVSRLLASKCEFCGTTEGKFEVHHVRKLKDLKGKKKWEQKMIARNRKTMVLCTNCHVDLHRGKLD